MLQFGDATIQKIVDLDRFVLPMSLIMPDHNLDELRPEFAFLAPDHVDFDANALLLGVHSFLLKVKGLTVLIDTCVGEHKPRPARADWHERDATGYLERLARAGVTPDEIDVVMCTHLHADHVGWNTRLDNGRWVPTFPRARYVMGRVELAHWQDAERLNPGNANHGAFNDSVLPIIKAGLAEPVDEGFALTSKLDIVGCAGHSPGQIGLQLDGGDAGQALFCGDVMHSPVQVFRPKWSSAFCYDSEQACRTREDLLKRSAEEDLLLLPGHIRNAHGLRIRRHGSGFRPITA